MFTSRRLLMAAARTNQVTIVSDTFTGTNGTSLSGHTPDIRPTGSFWEAITGITELQLNTNQARAVGTTNGQSIANVIQTNSANVEITCTITVNNSNNAYPNSIILRYTDENNYYRATLDPTTNALRLDKRESGSTAIVLYNTEGSTLPTQGVPITYTLGSTLTITVRAEGSKVTLIYGSQRLTYTNQTFNQNATKHGLLGSNRTTGSASTRFDTFLVKSLSSVSYQTPTVWFHADYGAYTVANAAAADGEEVAMWLDHSGHGYSAIKQVASERPNLSATAYTGNLPAIFFDNANSENFLFRCPASSGLTVAINYRVPANTFATAHLDMFRLTTAAGINSDRIGLWIYDSPRETRAFYYANGSNQNFPVMSATDDDTWHLAVISVDFSSGRTIVRFDKAAVLDDNPGTGVLPNGNYLYGSLGNAFDAYPIKCYVREMRIYDSAFSSAQMQTVETVMVP